MKHEGSTTRLNALLRANAVAPPEPPESAPDLIELLVHSFLMWEASRAQADAAMVRIRAATVSFNDFRVSLVKEVVDLIGVRYPMAQERAIRVRAAINDLFRREHAVSLERVGGLSKRDARLYLESLQGMVPFVASRVSLLGLDAHAIPVDEQTLATLAHQGVLHPETNVVEATGWLQRHVPGEKALATHLALQHAAEAFVAKVTPRGAAKVLAAAAAERAAREAKAARPVPEPVVEVPVVNGKANGKASGKSNVAGAKGKGAMKEPSAPRNGRDAKPAVATKAAAAPKASRAAAETRKPASAKPASAAKTPASSKAAAPGRSATTTKATKPAARNRASTPARRARPSKAAVSRRGVAKPKVKRSPKRAERKPVAAKKAARASGRSAKKAGKR